MPFVKYIVKFTVITMLLVMNLISKVYGQDNAVDFDRLNVEHGLSQNTVYTTIQDHKGFLWMGTDDGLNRYDGYSFKVYTNRIGVEGAISNSRVIALLEDSKHRLWVGTIGGGLNRYLWETDTFINYRHSYSDSTSLSNNRVMALAEDVSGKIWIGTADGGLNLFDPETETFKAYINTPERPDVLPSNVIRSLYVDSKNILWVGTDNGIATYCSETNLFTPFNIKLPQGNGDLKIIRRFLEDKEGNLWIATDEEGLICYNIKTQEYNFYRFNPKNKNSIPHNTVHDLLLDEAGSMWIATYGGLSKLNLELKTFTNYFHSIIDPNSIGSNLIRSLFEDSTGVFWVGTFDNGLSRSNIKFKKFTVYRNYPGNSFYLGASSAVVAIHQDKQGFLWLGTYGEGIAKLDLEKNSFEQIKHSPNTTNSLPNDYITSIDQDSKGYLWISTYDGIAKYDPISKIFKQFKHNPDQPSSLPDRRIRYVYVDSNDDVWTANLNYGLSKLLPDGNFKTYRHRFDDSKTITQDRLTILFEDSKDNFWIGTSNEGLNLFDREKEEVVKVYREDDLDSTSIISSRVLSFYEDSKERLWVGTDEGLSLFNYDTETFTNFTSQDGLPNDVIYGILEDGQGRLWMSTNNGISCFTITDADNFTFRNYDKYDGFPSNEFSLGSSCILNNGQLAFGGINNFILFNPLSIMDNEVDPLAYIYEARIIERGSNDENKEETTISLFETDSLTFNYSQNNLSLYVTVLHYIAPQKNRYKYMLEGFDKSWVVAQNSNRFIKYTNLKPGKYTFRVIAQNPDGRWNAEGDSFTFTITPPFWQTWLFYLGLAILAVLLIYGLIVYRDTRLLHAKENLEGMVALRTKELSNQSEELRLQTESLHRANDDINAKSLILKEQNRILVGKNNEITIQRNELEEQKNSLANLAWELQDKNEEITEQRNEIERQKIDITDSIMYAQRIQEAVLPTQHQIRDLFPEFFIVNKPKSIVSGDFYWATRIGRYRIVAVVDCTGHGVPGGFMSMLGVLMLNEVISLRGIVNPAEVLNQLREGIISVLHQKGESEDSTDGMDLSLCVIDDYDNTLVYSGANSAMIVYSPSKKPTEALNEYRSDRMPIAHHLIMDPFTNQTIKLEKGDMIYLYTDGIIDQFGGTQNKKFQPNNLRLFIHENKKLPMAEQGKELEKVFYDWKGNTFQVDDVLVMGLKV
ncbi:MAG: two-component regulator propeller domain-containing protein [Bacteroidales bacterium]|nr:two-component regulator propeller domain-containing protein [Bacteroidales bacterium]